MLLVQCKKILTNQNAQNVLSNAVGYEIYPTAKMLKKIAVTDNVILVIVSTIAVTDNDILT